MYLSDHSLIVVALVGIIAGWFAGRLMRGRGFGIVGDLVVGLVGALIGGWLLPMLHVRLGAGIFALIVNALVGAIVLVFVLWLLGSGSGWRYRGWDRRGRRW